MAFVRRVPAWIAALGGYLLLAGLLFLPAWAAPGQRRAGGVRGRDVVRLLAFHGRPVPRPSASHHGHGATPGPPDSPRRARPAAAPLVERRTAWRAGGGPAAHRRRGARHCGDGCADWPR